MAEHNGTLRVLYLINGLGTGGAERSLAELIPQLRRRGVLLEVMCLESVAEGVQELVSTVTRVSFLNSTTFLGRIFELHRLLKDRTPSLLHTTLFEADVVGRLAAFGTNTPVLTSLVNTTYASERILHDPNLARIRLRIVRAIDSTTARHLTTHFHSLTNAVAQSAIENLGIRTQQISIIGRGRELGRLGIRSPERRATVRAHLRFRERDEIVLAVGRQEFQKGQVYLLEAAAQLRSDRPNLRILIAGRNGNATRQLQLEVEKLGLGGVVTFLGYRDDIGDLLAAADVFCFPSVYEGFGGALLEAMEMGVPVVASDLPAVREVLGETGTLVPAADSSSMSNALARVLDDRESALALAARASDRVSKLFDANFIADRMADLYRRIVSQEALGH